LRDTACKKQYKYMKQKVEMEKYFHL